MAKEFCWPRSSITLAGQTPNTFSVRASILTKQKQQPIQNKIQVQIKQHFKIL